MTIFGRQGGSGMITALLLFTHCMVLLGYTVSGHSKKYWILTFVAGSIDNVFV